MDILKEFPKKSLQKRLQRKHNFLALSEKSESEVKVAWSCPTPCNPMDYTVHGLLQARILEWVAFPSPGELPNPGIEPRCPTLQADSLPAKPQGKPKKFNKCQLNEKLNIYY